MTIMGWENPRERERRNNEEKNKIVGKKETFFENKGKKKMGGRGT